MAEKAAFEKKYKSNDDRIVQAAFKDFRKVLEQMARENGKGVDYNYAFWLLEGRMSYYWYRRGETNEAFAHYRAATNYIHKTIEWGNISQNEVYRMIEKEDSVIK